MESPLNDYENLSKRKHGKRFQRSLNLLASVLDFLEVDCNERVEGSTPSDTVASAGTSLETEFSFIVDLSA